MYLSFTEYAANGGTGDSSLFPRLAYRAERIVDRFTQRRVRAMAEVPEAVKRCMVELINGMVESDPTKAAISGVLTGFSNDGYSETYGNGGASHEAAMYSIVTDYLSDQTDDNGTPLLYRGVDA